MENTDRRTLEPSEEGLESYDKGTKATLESPLPEDLLEDLSISTSVADFSLMKISECQDQNTELPEEVNNTDERNDLTAARTETADEERPATQSAEEVSVGGRSSTSPVTPSALTSSFRNGPPMVSALYSQDMWDNDLVVEEVETAGEMEEREMAQETTLMERQNSHKSINSTGNSDEKIFIKKSSKEDLTTADVHPIENQDDDAPSAMTNNDADFSEDEEEKSLAGLDIIAENPMNAEDVDQDVIAPVDIKDEEQKQKELKKRQQSAGKQKDGAKKTVKTAPGRLANIIATKTPAQQRSIAAGVTKRLALRQSSLSLMANGKTDLKSGGSEKKQPNKLSNHKSQTSLTLKVVSEEDGNLPSLAKNYKPLPNISSGEDNGKILKPKEKKMQSKQDLEVTKRSSEKALDKPKKTGPIAAMKKRNTGVEKVLNSTKLKQPKLGKEESAKLHVENEVGEPAEDAAEGKGEATEPQPINKQDHLVTPAVDLTSGRKESLISNDSSYYVRMNQAQQDSEAAKLAEKKKEMLPVKLMSNDGSLLKSLIPYLPLPVAILCLILNICLPGVGTIVSGFSVLCCGRPRIDGKDDQIPKTVVLNLFVGIFQITTITFMLVGWFWSIFWGIYMVILSKSQNSNRGTGDDVESGVVLL